MTELPRAICDTPCGRLAGDLVEGVVRFLGVRYAAPPTGSRRLRSPAPPVPWTGTRAATAIGPAAPQLLAGAQTWLNEPIARQDEDCLSLNLWAPEGATDAPVLVWLHGGATRSGHGGMAAIDGARLARRHGLVVITVNYRLGPLGGLGHPDLTDPQTGHCANWGLQDQIAALEWVRLCVRAFGGDAANVTLAGQSSGAASALLIAQNPACRSLFHRVIAQSPPLFRPPMVADLDGAAAYTAALAAFLGTDVAGLRALDGAELVRREAAFLKAPGHGGGFARPLTAPTRDGRLVHAWPHEGAAADVPLLIGSTRDEALFWYDLPLPDGTPLAAATAPADGAALEAAVRRLIVQHYAFGDAPSPETVLAVYRAHHPGANLAALWLALYTDLVFRLPIRHYALRHARRGAPAFLYEFAWPLAPPVRGTPHAADVPFVFGTVTHPHLAAKIGDGATTTAAEVAALWAAFARSGRPGPDWPPLADGGQAVLGEARLPARFATLEADPLLALWTALRP